MYSYDAFGRIVQQHIRPTMTDTYTSTFDDSQTGTGVSQGVIQTGEANIANAFDSAGNRVQKVKDQERTRTVFDALSRVAYQFVISVNSVSDSMIRTYKGKETSSVDEAMATTIRTNNASTGIITEQSSKPFTPEHSISMNTDLLGRVESRTDSGTGTSTYIHDIYSNPLSETDANGRTQSWIRDVFDRVISYTNFAGQTTTWTYDAWGNILSETDPNSLSTSYAYDERNRVLRVTDADGGVTTSVYDVKGRKLSLTTPNLQTTSWTYDIYDRVLTETNALTQTKTFAYDSADRKTLVIKPDGNKIQYTYGNGQNATKEEWLVGADVVQTLNFQYDAVGKMTSASDSATSLAFTYTDGLLSREKQTLAAGIIAQSDYVYAGGQVREVSIGLGASATFDSKVSYTYTANGQVATLQQTGPTTDTKSVRYSYDQAGNRMRTERFSDLSFTIPVFETLSRYTNAQNQLKSTVQSIKHQRATGTILASYDFVRDAGNRLSSMTSTADGVTNYSYTPTNQLSSIDYASIPDQSFTYDLNGNRTGSGNVTGADNRLSSDATWDFLYDANGNMTRRTLKSNNSYIEYTYDHRDRLTEVRHKTSAGTQTKRVLYGYDALNRRYKQTVEGGPNAGTVYYVNQGFRKDRGDAGDEVALRLDGTGAVISRYLHGSLVDEVLAEENIGSGGVRDVLWAMTDHQGSVRDLARVTAGTASVVNHIVYDSFGKTVSETDAAIAHLYGYTGREFDKETGLQYNRARYLDLVLARFISQDPKSFDAGDTNLYRYVGNHPSYATDPSGLQEPSSRREFRIEGAPEVVIHANGFIEGLDQLSMDEATEVIQIVSKLRMEAKKLETRINRLQSMGISGIDVQRYDGISDGALEFYQWLHLQQKHAGEVASERRSLQAKSDRENFRLLGQAVQGASELVVGSGTAAAGLGVTPLGWGGLALAAHGLDTLTSVFRSVDAGERVDTLTSQAIQATGLSRDVANWVDFGIGFVGTIGVTSLEANAARISGLRTTRIVGEAPVKTVDMMAETGQLGGKLYGPEKLGKLQRYLKRRGIAMYPARNGSFDGVKGIMELPPNATVLNVRHELSHMLDFKKYGPNYYKKFNSFDGEEMVLDRLMNNRVWNNLNEGEKSWSLLYPFTRKGGQAW